MTINDNGDRLAANHHRNREEGSRIQIRRRGHRAISHAVERDAFTPVLPSQQATVAWLGTKGMVSVKLAEGHSEPLRPLRAQPQARLATQRDRRPIPGALTPGSHPSIGRSVISPIIALGGSEL